MHVRICLPRVYDDVILEMTMVHVSHVPPSEKHPPLGRNSLVNKVKFLGLIPQKW